MLTCPHCRAPIRIRELPHQGYLKSFRICPECGGKFDVDPATKYRQATAIVVSIISLIFTVLVFMGQNEWLPAAITSYVVLGIMIYWGNKRVYLVPYEKQ